MIEPQTKELIIMADTTNLSIRIDRDLKDEADRIFGELGMNLTTAITVFVRQAVRQKKIPFEITLDTDREKSLRNAADALAGIWQDSVRNGMDKMSMDDIDAEISAVRRER
jgi:DNA-damage-inducible protein J